MTNQFLSGDSLLACMIASLTVLALATVMSASGPTLALSPAVMPPFHARNLQMAEQLAHQMVIHRGHNNHQQQQQQHYQEQNSGLKLDTKQQQQVQEAVLAPPVNNQRAQEPPQVKDETRNQKQPSQPPPPPPQQQTFQVDPVGETKKQAEQSKTQQQLPSENPASVADSKDNDDTTNGDQKLEKPANSQKQPLMPRILKAFGLGLGFVGRK